MSDDPKIGRRKWLVNAARLSVGAAAARLLAQPGPLAAAETASHSAGGAAGGRMRVTMVPHDLSDETLVYLKEVGFDDLLIFPDTIPGYKVHCEIDFDQLMALKRRIEAHGLRFAGISLDQRILAEHLLGQPGGELALDKMCRLIEAMGKAGIPLLLYSLLISRAIFNTTGRSLPGYTTAKGRGGAELKAFDESLAKAVTAQPDGPVSAEEMWARIERFQRRCVPVAEAAKVTLTLHPDDPPVATHWGVSQVLRTMDGLKRAMAMVPSPNNCLLFCQGTIQVAGIDLFEYIRTFGPPGKIAHVEFRGAHGRVPRFTEDFMDQGDVSLWRLVEALKAVGYTGLIEVAHVPLLAGDRRRYVVDAWSAGFIKGMLEAAYA